jgi:succinyl-diaminopimelate desuccinylase
VAEFGLIGKTIHQVNEHAEIADIKNLKKIYKAFLVRYFAV